MDFARRNCILLGVSNRSDGCFDVLCFPFEASGNGSIIAEPEEPTDGVDGYEQ
jgi:hypothetical protein